MTTGSGAFGLEVVCFLEFLDEDLDLVDADLDLMDEDVDLDLPLPEVLPLEVFERGSSLISISVFS